MSFTAQGSFVAIVTPFDQKGRIDKKKLEKLLAWQVDSGTQGIVACGTTGEGMTLSEKDRENILITCVSYLGGSIPVIINSGTADTRASVKLTEKMLKHGASACLIPTPYYNKPTQKGAILHFTEIGKVGLPVIVYNNSGRTIKLDAETVIEIAGKEGIVGYKDSTTDIELIKEVKKRTNMAIFAGDDHFTFETMKAGGVGAISVIGNLFPSEWKNMIDLCLKNKWDEAKKISDHFIPMYEALFLETNPQCVKYAMSLLGKCEKNLRLPMIEPSLQNQEKIKVALSKFLPL